MVARIELEHTRSVSDVVEMISALELRGFWLEEWVDPTPEKVLAQSRRYLAENPVAMLSLGINTDTKSIVLTGSLPDHRNNHTMTYHEMQSILSYNDG